MATQDTDYIGGPQGGGPSGTMMMAEMGFWWGAGLAADWERKIFQGLGSDMWRGSSKLTNQAYRGVRRQTQEYLRSRPFKVGASGKAFSMLPAQEEAYSQALRLMQRKGGGPFSRAAWSSAGRRGITGQFAKLAVSKLGRAVQTGIDISIFAGMATEGVRGYVTTMRGIGRAVPRQEFGERFQDTQGSYTERQRAVRAITSSRLSTRSAIGNEAQLMHR